MYFLPATYQALVQYNISHGGRQIQGVNWLGQSISCYTRLLKRRTCIVMFPKATAFIRAQRHCIAEPETSLRP
jgi:hypothetical protein